MKDVTTEPTREATIDNQPEGTRAVESLLRLASGGSFFGRQTAAITLVWL